MGVNVELGIASCASSVSAADVAAESTRGSSGEVPVHAARMTKHRSNPIIDSHFFMILLLVKDGFDRMRL
jgi:hypothetical protein